MSVDILPGRMGGSGDLAGSQTSQQIQCGDWGSRDGDTSAFLVFTPDSTIILL